MNELRQHSSRIPHPSPAQFWPENAGMSVVRFFFGLILAGVLIAAVVILLGENLRTYDPSFQARAIHNDMQDISDAAQLYNAETGVRITDPDLTYGSEETWRDHILNDHFREIPKPPRDGRAKDFVGAYRYDMADSEYTQWHSPWGPDSVVRLRGVADDVCRQVNMDFTFMKDADSRIPSEPAPQFDLQCYGRHNVNVVVKPVDIDHP